MYCKVFAGVIPDAVQQYNDWSKGKTIDKDVIIHTHASPNSSDGKIKAALLIVVFFDEQKHKDWVDDE